VVVRTAQALQLPQSTTKYYGVLQSSTKHCSVLSNTKLRITKHYPFYYKVLLCTTSTVQGGDYSAFQLSILSEVRLLNFLRLVCTAKKLDSGLQSYYCVQIRTPKVLLCTATTSPYYKVLQYKTLYCKVLLVLPCLQSTRKQY